MQLLVLGGNPVAGRVVTTKLPAPVAAKAERRAAKPAAKKRKRIDPRTLQAAHFVTFFTTLPETMLGAREVLKRLKQLLKLGRLPHKQPAAAGARAALLSTVRRCIDPLRRSRSTNGVDRESSMRLPVSIVKGEAG